MLHKVFRLATKVLSVFRVIGIVGDRIASSSTACTFEDGVLPPSPAAATLMTLFESYIWIALVRFLVGVCIYHVYSTPST